MSYLEVTTPDDRVLEVLISGAPDGFPLVYHSGSPSAAVPYPQLDDAALTAGLRVITYSRPGYGGSSPRHPEQGPPHMADDVTDVVSILEHLGIGDFVTLGWSGGGPRALACAALLPGRCRAATSLAGVAPYDAEGLDWYDGMAPENLAEYTAAAQGPEAYEAFLVEDMLPVLSASAEEVAAAMGELLTPVDAAALDVDFLSATFNRAGAQGVIGVRDDGLAAYAPWGFDLASITVPVAVWQGDQDAMVPLGHGAWLAAHVPGAVAHLVQGEGHISLIRRIDEILAELRGLAGLV